MMRILPAFAAVGTAALAGGWLMAKPNSKNVEPVSPEGGMKSYPFVDCKRFDLINVSVFFRHGARTPTYFINSKYPTPNWESDGCFVDLIPELCYDVKLKELPSNTLINEETIQEEYVEHMHGKCSAAQLTLIGQQQSLGFGKELRRIYMDGYKLIQQEFDENEILLRSTKFPRTYYTLKGVMSGLYGANSFDTCHRPIIHTMPIVKDPFFPNSSICPVVEQFSKHGLAIAAKDPDIIRMKCIIKNMLGVSHFTTDNGNSKGLGKDFRRCEKEVSNKEKVESSQVDELPLYSVRDDLIARQVHSFEVPPDFNKVNDDLTRQSSKELLYEILGGPNEWEERVPLLVSPMINYVLSNMRMAIKKSSVTENSKCVKDIAHFIEKKQNIAKLQIVSCHDTTMMPLMLCLRIHDGLWPLFMSSIIFELYKEKETNHLYTRTLYNGEVQKIVMDELSCEETEYQKMGFVPYATFEKFLEKYSIPDDSYTSACDKAAKIFATGKPMTKDQYL